MNNDRVFDRRNQRFFERAFSHAQARAKRGLHGAVGVATELAGIACFQRVQAAKRAAAAKAGKTVPGILISSVTRGCNLDCAGCYSKTLRPGTSAELSDERFLQLFREAVDLGVGTLMIAGGEPLLRRSLLEQLALMNGPIVPVFTNGTLFDEACLDLFAGSRMVPIFSVEGDAAFTAQRRGDGIHEKALAAAAALRERGALFGFSVTLTSKNADAVLSDQFLSGIATEGAATLFLIEFVPAAPGTEDLVLREAQKMDLSRPGRFDEYPFMTISLPGDEEAFGGCLAAGRGFIHLADDGSLEACPFAPFSDVNAAQVGLAAALDSPLMRAIRERHNELTETKGGCALWNKKGWVATLGACAARKAS